MKSITTISLFPVLIILFATLHKTNGASRVIRSSSSPTNVTAIVGGEALIKCNCPYVGNECGYCDYINNDGSVFDIEDIRGDVYNRYKVFTSHNTCTVVIKNVTRTDAGSHECINRDKTNTQQTRTFKLNVQFPPTTITLENFSNCTTGRANPAAEIEWDLENSVILSSYYSTTSSDGDETVGFTTSSILTHKYNEEHQYYNMELSCVAKHPALQTELRNSKVLKFDFLPVMDKPTCIKTKTSVVVRSNPIANITCNMECSGNSSVCNPEKDEEDLYEATSRWTLSLEDKVGCVVDITATNNKGKKVTTMPTDCASSSSTSSGDSTNWMIWLFTGLGLLFIVIVLSIIAIFFSGRFNEWCKCFPFVNVRRNINYSPREPITTTHNDDNKNMTALTVSTTSPNTDDDTNTTALIVSTTSPNNDDDDQK